MLTFDWHHPTDSKNMDTAVTAGIITTGISFAQIEEIFAAANVCPRKLISNIEK